MLLAIPSSTITISPFPCQPYYLPVPTHHPSRKLIITSTKPSRLEHQHHTFAAVAFGISLCPARRRRRPPNPNPAPLPSCDTSLNHQHSSRWALGTSYCRPVADIRPPISAQYDTYADAPNTTQVSSTNNTSAGPWELHASACRRQPSIRSISSEHRTYQTISAAASAPN